MQKPVALLLFVALLAGVLMLWQPWSHAADAPTGFPGQGTLTEEPDREPSTSGLEGQAPERRDETPAAAKAKRDAVEDDPAETPAPLGGPQLRVIDGVTKAPVANPVVYFLQIADLNAEQRAELMRRRTPQSGLFGTLEKFGRKLHGNAVGELSLPPITDQCAVGCQHQTKSGLLRPRKDSSAPLVLELFDVRGIRILVQDAVGQPAAKIPVVLAIRRGDLWRQLWESETNDEGIAEIEHLQQLLSVSNNRPDAKSETAAFVTLPFAERPRADVNLLDPPADPVVIQLPPVGSVEVVLEHPDPTRLSDARVHLANEDAAQDGLHWLNLDRAAEGGRAVFDHVGLGLQLKVTGQLRGGNVSSTVEAMGPTAPGQRVVVRVALTAGEPVLVAELRNEAGELLRSVSLSSKVKAKKGGSSSSSGFTTQTDKNGRIHIEVEDGFGTKAERSLQFTLEGSPIRTVRVEVPPIHPGENDLGVLTLRPPPLVCSGRVTNRGGDPIANADVQIYRKVVYDANLPRGFFWEGADVPGTATNARGEFSITGILAAVEHGISIEAPRYLAIERQPFTIGSAGLQFTMNEAAALSGSLLIGGTFLQKHIRIEVVNSARERETNEDLKSNGKFRFDELYPGNVDLRVRLLGGPAPVYERNGIEVVAGEETKLGDIDLTDTVHKISFRVRDRDGRPARDAIAVVRHPGNKNIEGVFLDAGRGQVLSPAETVNVLVYGEGFRNARVDGVRDGQEIELAPAHEITIQLPQGVTPPQGKVALSVEMVSHQKVLEQGTRVEIRSANRTSSMSGSVPWQRTKRGVVDAGGAAVVRLPDSGRYELRWTVKRTSGGTMQTVSVDPPQIIEVPEAHDRFAVTATVTQNALDAALAVVR